MKTTRTTAVLRTTRNPRKSRKPTLHRRILGAGIASLCAFAALSPVDVHAQAVITFNASLDGTQEVPPTGSPGTGAGMVVLDTAAGMIAVDLNWDSLTAIATAAHIHKAAVGVNGPVIFTLSGVPAAPTGAIPTQSFAITGPQITDLESGLNYMNVHSTAFPGGEIRGQLFISAVDVALGNTATISANIPGSGFSKTGAGKLTLSGTNTYTGFTTINDGTVSVTVEGNLGASSISFYGGELLVDGGTFSTTKYIEIGDNSTGRLSNSNTGSEAVFSGNLVLGLSSTLAIGSAGNTGVVTLKPGVGSSFTATPPNNPNVSVDFGTLRNGDANGFTMFTSAAATTTVASGATLDANGFASSILNLQGAGTLTNNGASAVTYTITSGNFSGAINDGVGTVALVKNGTDTDVLTLSGASNYSGGTTLSAGTLLVGNNSALGTGPLTINGGALGSSQNSTTLANPVFVNADFMVYNPSAGSNSLALLGTVDLGGASRTITGANLGSLYGVLDFFNPIVNGTGLTFTSNPNDFFIFQMLGGASNTYTGVTTVDQVTLVLNKTSSAIAVPGDLVVKNQGLVGLVGTNANLIAGTSITLDTGDLASFSDYTLPASKTITLIGTSNYLVSTSPFTFTVDSKITGAGGIHKNSTGALVLTNGANDYSGGTVLNAGTLFVDAISALGTGPLTITGNSTLASHVINFQLLNPLVVQSDFSIKPAGGYANVMSLLGNITLGTTATITNTSGVLGVGVRIFGAISGGANGIGFSSTAPSQFAYVGSAANSYTGLTTINANAELGLFKTTPNTAILGDVLINPGGALFVSGSGEQIADTATVTVNSAGNTLFGDLGFMLVGGNETIGTLNGNSVGTVALNFFSSAHTLTVGAGDFSGVISDGGFGGQLVKNGPGTLFLRGANTYTGATTVNAGTLAIDKDGVTTFGTLGSGPVTVNGATTTGGLHGTLQFLNNASAGSGAFTTNGGTANLALGGATRFSDSSSAGTGTFTTNGAAAIGAVGGVTDFLDSATAASGNFTNNGPTGTGTKNGFTRFFDNATAGDGTFTNNGATLSLAFGGATAFFDNSTAANATLIANAGASGTFGSRILFIDDSTGGTATVKVFGNGNLDVSGHNAPGVTIGSLEGDGNAFLGAVNLTVGSNNTSTTFSGVMQDGGNNGGTGGSLTKVGTGTLILPNANTYTGDTNINGGTLFVDGSLASANVRVNAGGTLGGGGTLFGNVFNHGLLSPGHSPGTMNIGGDFTQFADGTLRIEVASKAVFDRLIVGGRVTLGGTVALVQQNGFTLAPGDKLVLATAAGGVAGGSANGTALPASNVTGAAALSSNALLVPTVNLYTTTVVLELMQGSFASLSSSLNLTANQLAVAQALDSVSALIGSKTGVFSELNFLDTQPLSTLASNLDKIAPEELTSIFHIAVSLSKIQSANIERRLDDIRASAGEIASVNSVNVSAGSGAQGPVGRPGKSCPLAEEERWGLWFAGSGEFTHIGSTTNAAGFDLDSGGVTAGVDYRFTDHFAAGISLGYMNTTADLANGGKVDVDGGRIGLYATYFDRGFYVDAAVNGGFNSYKTRRTTPNNTSATGSPEGSEVNVLFATGYDWKFGGLTIGPTASFNHTHARLDGFTETGAFAPLTISSQTAESTRTALGMRAYYDAHVGGVTVRPEARVSWQHEFGDSNYAITSRFATLGGNAFTVQGSALGRDSLLVGAGLSVQWTKRFATYAYYDGELCRTNYVSHNVSAGCRWRF